MMIKVGELLLWWVKEMLLLLLILMRRDAAAATCRNNRRLAKAEGDCEVELELVVTALEVFMLLSASLRTVITYGRMD
jgi:hypothetical protein